MHDQQIMPDWWENGIDQSYYLPEEELEEGDLDREREVFFSRFFFALSSNLFNSE